jgi:hypothetical protein
MKTTHPNVKVVASELQLADEVSMVSGNETWKTCIVKQIANGQVHLFRPYGVTADFSYTGGVICYVGIEEYQVSIDSKVEYILHRRTELK